MHFLAWPIAYLLGGLNFGIIISKLFYKNDVRKIGSGNAGATNMLRSFGKLPAVVVFIGDMAKGAAAVYIAKLLSHGEGSLEYVWLVSGFLVIIGHVFPAFFHFKGGKGVATAAGVVLYMQPLLAAAMVVMFLVISVTTKYISLGSLVSAALLPFAMFALHKINGDAAMPETVLCAAIAVLVVFMHRQNILRLIKGEENKISSKKSER